jgi:hypothetical protein
MRESKKGVMIYISEDLNERLERARNTPYGKVSKTAFIIKALEDAITLFEQENGVPRD